MQRKIIQIANSTHLVSLPKKWVDKQGIKKGDEINIKESGKNLTITPLQESKEPSSIELDITGLDKDSLIFLIRGLYIRGYDQIKFIFKKPVIEHHRLNKEVKVFTVIHGEVNRSTGLEIIEQKNDYCELRNMSSHSMKEFDPVLRRIFLLIIDAMNDFYEAIKNHDFLSIETIEEKHDTITKLILHNLRLLNLYGSQKQEDNTFLFHIVSSLDLIIDIIKDSSRRVVEQKTKVSKQGMKILSEIKESFNMYYKLYYDFNFSSIKNFSLKRDKIRIMVSELESELTKKDIWLIVTMQHCLEIFRNLYTHKSAIGY